MIEGSTYSVTPAAHISTLKPENVSNPLAISGGWKAGDPWLVLQVSSTANGPNLYKNRKQIQI